MESLVNVPMVVEKDGIPFPVFITSVNFVVEKTAWIRLVITRTEFVQMAATRDFMACSAT